MKEKIRKFLATPLFRVLFKNQIAILIVNILEAFLVRFPSKPLKKFTYLLIKNYFSLYAPEKEYLVKSDLFGKMLVRKAEMINSYIYFFKIWEPNLTKIVLDNLDKEDVFIDIGANIGYYTLVAARRCGHVLAFEASPSIFQKLEQNINLNNLQNVEAHNCAILDKKGKISINIGRPENLGRTSIFVEENTKFECEVEAFPVTDFLNDDILQKIKIIKIDVEGAEPYVLKNIYQILNKLPDKVILLLEIIPEILAERFKTDPHTLLKPFIDGGFRFFLIPNDYMLDSYLGVDGAKKIEEITAEDLRYKLKKEHTDLMITKNGNFYVSI